MTSHLLHEGMAPDFIPRRRSSPDLEWVEVDGEVVAWTRDPDGLHRLDQIATLVFQLSDGSTTIQQTVAELAEAFDVDPERVRVDVERCLRSMIEQRLIEATA